MSQCSRVLEVLRDGEPHSIQEIHERAGTMRLNSRISDLRKMGWFITYYRKDGLHIYRLLYGTVRTADVATDGDSGQPSAVRTAPDISGPPEAVGPGPCSPPAGARQPTLWESAA